MNWVTVIWSLAAGACIGLGIIYLLIWRKVPAQHASFAFAVAAIATAAIAFHELSLITCADPGSFEQTLRWAHLPLAILLIALAYFVRYYFGTVRPWLFWIAVGTRLLVLLVNFIGEGSVNISDVKSLKHMYLLGQQVTLMGEAVTSPWNVLAVTNSLFFWFSSLMHQSDSGGEGMLIRGVASCVSVVLSSLSCCWRRDMPVWSISKS